MWLEEFQTDPADKTSTPEGFLRLSVDQVADFIATYIKPQRPRRADEDEEQYESELYDEYWKIDHAVMNLISNRVST